MWRLIFRALLAARLRLAPPAPGRFGDLARLFRAAHPEADGDAWEAFCGAHAAAAYWEGERRGFDRARGLGRAALARRHDWAAPAASSRPALAEPHPGGTPEELEAVRALVHAAAAAGVPVELRRSGG